MDRNVDFLKNQVLTMSLFVHRLTPSLNANTNSYVGDQEDPNFGEREQNIVFNSTSHSSNIDVMN